MQEEQFEDLKVSHFNKEDEDKLISNCLLKSYLGNNNNSNSVRRKKMIFDSARHKANKQKTQIRYLKQSVWKAQEQIINECLWLDLFVRVAKRRQQTFFSNFCSGQSQSAILTCCVISDITSSQFFVKQKPSLQDQSQKKADLKQILQMKDLFYFNFQTVQAQIIVKKNSQTSKAMQYTSILQIGDSFSLELYIPIQSDKLKVKQFKTFINQLKLKIQKSSGKKYGMKQILSYPFFQTNHYKSQQQFFKQCQTGDILLFQSQRFAAKVQRFVTGSEYDHVAIIIKDPTYDILIYEAVANGVCLTPWKLVIQYKWYETISKITWRRLTGITRDLDLKLRCHEFVMLNIQKPYFISVNKLASNTSFIANSQQEQGFFCSELVARVYKILQLLPRPGEDGYLPACNYYPYHFTEKNNLKMVKGQLSPQYQIIFDQKVIQQAYSPKQNEKIN